MKNKYTNLSETMKQFEQKNTKELTPKKKYAPIVVMTLSVISLLFLLSLLFSCNKEETPQPITQNQSVSLVDNNYSMTTLHLDSSPNSQYLVVLNGDTINSYSTIIVSTGDHLTGQVTVLGSLTHYTGVTFVLNGINSYTKDGYIDNSEQLVIDYTVE